MDTNGIKLTPKDIVSKLNEYIVGQDDAKRKVAIALRTVSYTHLTLPTIYSV